MTQKKAAKPPMSAADRRPGNKPYYIPEHCAKCGAQLVLSDSLKRKNGAVWHDEWVCPQCQDGIFMDWPKAALQELRDAAKR